MKTQAGRAFNILTTSSPPIRASRRRGGRAASRGLRPAASIRNRPAAAASGPRSASTSQIRTWTSRGSRSSSAFAEWERGRRPQVGEGRDRLELDRGPGTRGTRPGGPGAVPGGAAPPGRGAAPPRTVRTASSSIAKLTARFPVLGRAELTPDQLAPVVGDRTPAVPGVDRHVGFQHPAGDGLDAVQVHLVVVDVPHLAWGVLPEAAVQSGQVHPRRLADRVQVLPRPGGFAGQGQGDDPGRRVRVSNLRRARSEPG